MICLNSRLIVAIDTADAGRARALIDSVTPYCGVIKIGLELFSALGPAAFAVAGNHKVFLDLKFHDIPNTVAGAIRSILPRRPAMLTVHAAGGRKMIAAARSSVETAGDERPILLAVTVLTSLSSDDLAATGVADSASTHVLRLARLALESGADGLVCSPRELSMLRAEFGAGPILVVPGIRPKGAIQGDQIRVAFPADAVRAGADYLVVGRPITEAADIGAAAAAIAKEIADEIR